MTLQYTNGNSHVDSHQKVPWHEIETFPRDGRVVEVRNKEGDVWLAAWHFGRIAIDADVPVAPTHWRVTI